ncbi:hypothetical protein KO561_06215 [Radiobacillus kanasensis]|uniref:hypothetical protein n=1 Tax=Radiobacillus kanasensis TaxID=2844358 RepID=UPI001E41D95D|nr:hypothetical protein [Radiobacillus kanasensis]UFU00533.1 hypothetical protein KO561_06215 [Radiobacillus kanasensis]
MNSFFYGLFAVVLAILSLYTGEVVTFLMLGFILISLQNINMTLKKLVKQKESD